MRRVRATGSEKLAAGTLGVVLCLLAGAGLLLAGGCYPKAQVYGVGDVGGLVFAVNPPDAEVILDGVVQGKASEFPEERYLKVAGGKHRLELRRAGYESYIRELYVSNALLRIEVTLVEGRSPGPGGY